MKLKNLPFWLKFAIVFTIIFCILFYIAGATNPTCKMGVSCPIPFMSKIMQITILPIYFIIKDIISYEDNYLLLILPVYYFVTGSIIGWIISKIKSRGKK